MMWRIHKILAAALVFAGLAAGAVMYWRLPETVPVHWNVRGQADGFGPRWVDAFLFPAISAVLLVMLAFLPRMSRWKENMDRFARTYGRIVVTVMAGLLAIHVVVLLKAAGHRVQIERALPVVVGVLIAVLGNWMGKIRRNSLVGIRTPWTLGSDLVWEKTHRMGARLMLAYGLGVVVAALVGTAWITMGVLVGGALGLAVWAMVYSWGVSKRVGVEG